VGIVYQKAIWDARSRKEMLLSSNSLRRTTGSGRLQIESLKREETEGGKRFRIADIEFLGLENSRDSTDPTDRESEQAAAAGRQRAGKG
jgi:hypothetical protein